MVARFPRRTSLLPGRSHDQPRPHLVQPLDNLIAWPTEHAAPDHVGEPQTLSAEIRIKRFSGLRDVEQTVATTRIEATSASPAAMISALSAAMEQDPDLVRASNPGDPMILEIRLVL